MFAKLEKHTFKISCIALVLSVVTLIFNIYITQKEAPLHTRTAIYKAILDDSDNPNGFLKGVERPGTVTHAGVEILEESTYQAKATFVMENKFDKYIYKINVRGMGGLPIYFGLNKLELVSIEKTLTSQNGTGALDLLPH